MDTSKQENKKLEEKDKIRYMKEIGEHVDDKKWRFQVFAVKNAVQNNQMTIDQGNQILYK